MERPRNRDAAAPASGISTAARAAIFSTTRSLMLIVPSSVCPGRASEASGRMAVLLVIGCRAGGAGRTEVQVALQHLGDDEADRAEQGHDEHVPEVAERQGQAEGEPDHDADGGGACHVISHSQSHEVVT